MSSLLLVLGSTRETMACEEKCLGAGLKCQIIPVPTEISSECGIAIEALEKDKANIESVCAAAGHRPKFYSRMP